MIFLFITTKISTIINEKHEMKLAIQVLMKFAMNYVNKTCGLHLIFNYPLYAHKTIESKNTWVNVDDDIIENQLNDSVICISDDESDSYEDVRSNAEFKHCKIISQTIELQNIEHSTDNQWTCCCCINYSAYFKLCFENTEFRIILDNETASVSCPCCYKSIGKTPISDHLNNCIAFKA